LRAGKPWPKHAARHNKAEPSITFSNVCACFVFENHGFARLFFCAMATRAMAYRSNKLIQDITEQHAMLSESCVFGVFCMCAHFSPKKKLGENEAFAHLANLPL
jgi:hypothetical protein